MSDERHSGGPGVKMSGGNVSVAGDIVDHHPATGAAIPNAGIEEAFKTATEAVRRSSEARAKLEELMAEAAKGDEASDSAMARLVKAIVGLVPESASAIAAGFSSPVLGGIAGPVTKYVLAEIQSR